MRIGIVVNPRARGAQDPRLPGRLQALGERPGIACQTVTTARPEDLPETVAGLGALDVLGVCGGDGTLMATLSALLAAPAGALPALLLMPAGTMNTVAKNLGLPPRPEALLRATLAAAQPGGLSAVPFWPQETLRVRTYGETPYSAAPPPAAAAPLTEALLQALPRRERCGFLFSGAMGAHRLVPVPGRRDAGALAVPADADPADRRLRGRGGGAARGRVSAAPSGHCLRCRAGHAGAMAGGLRAGPLPAHRFSDLDDAERAAAAAHLARPAAARDPPP